MIRQDTFVDGGAGTNAVAMHEETGLTTTIMGPHALFSGIRIKINNKNLSDSSSGDFLYPYNAFFKKCLMQKKGSSHYSGWLTDLENCDLNQPYMDYGNLYGGFAGGSPNIVMLSSQYKRRARWNGIPLVDGYITMAMKFADGVFMTPYYLVDGCDVVIEISKNLMKGFGVIGEGTADPTANNVNSGLHPNLQILPVSFVMWVDRVYPTEDSLTILKQVRFSQPLKYPKLHCSISTVKVDAAGSANVSLSNLCSGQIPDLVVIAVVDYNSMCNKNTIAVNADPFVFEYLTNEVPVSGQGVKLAIGSDSYPNYGLMQTHIEAYESYVKNTANYDFLNNTSEQPFLSFQQWDSIHPIYCFSLRSDGDMVFGAKSNTLRRGAVNLEWHVAGDFGNDVNVIIAAYSNTEYWIDANGAVNMQGF